MANEIYANRRRFLGAAAMTLAAAQFGTSDKANDREPRELAAFNRATEWFNSPRLTGGLGDFETGIRRVSFFFGIHGQNYVSAMPTT